MQIGVFVPTLSGGWLITPARKPCEPSFDFLRQVVQRAEHYGMEFALSPVKFKGFGGPSEFWDRGVEAITMTAGLAAATSRIKLFASIATLTIHPAITARMAATIDSISHGRFGLNIVSGWAAQEYEQMGLWPGEAHYKRRYEFTTEYVHIMRELWEKGRSDFSGEFFKLKDCVLAPRPQSRIELVCAGQSDRGMAFCADYGDYMFCVGTGVNKPDFPSRHYPAAAAGRPSSGTRCRSIFDYHDHCRGNRRGGVRQMAALQRNRRSGRHRQRLRSSERR